MGRPAIVHTFAWRARPAAANSRWQTGYTLPTSLRDARPCRLADLETHTDAGPAAGTVYAGVDVHNISSTACGVQGTPEVELLAPDGVVWQSNAAAADQPGPKVVLVPNSWATTGGFAVAASCEAGNLTTTLRLALPGQAEHRSLPLVVGRLGKDGCGADYGAWKPHPGQLEVTAFRSIPRPDRGGQFLSLTWLERSITVPPTVRRGHILRYTLTTEDPEPNASVTDDQPCPLFTQELSGVVSSASYELNCDTIVEFLPGQAVAYDLRLSVPADAWLGAATLSFQFLEPALPALTASVTIVG